MIIEALQALFTAGLIIGLATFGMVYWSLRQGFAADDESIKSLRKSIKQKKKESDKWSADWFDIKQRKENRESDFIHKKWVQFGGGFYGIVAFVTLLWVECQEVIDFFRNFTSLYDFISNVSLGLVIEFMIDALMNFIVAIAWPAYWINVIESNHIWIWFLVAYAGYTLGDRLARQRFSTG